ncbi:MAG: hypothetical protein HND48_20410 [Chloroflexi bacterium]|nr:hypothetical protein [Chloroflexota bacterium]
MPQAGAPAGNARACRLEGLLNRPVVWASVIYPPDDPVHKQVQNGEAVFVAPLENNTIRKTTDVELVRWASEAKVSALVFHEAVSPSALAEAQGLQRAGAAAAAQQPSAYRRKVSHLAAGRPQGPA